MKKFFRILLPIVLVFAVLGSLVWYLFVYDRDFTQDFLLSQARRCESNGDHQTATWFYNLAYDYADHSDDVALELARQYKENDNYTKAEFTLSQAISDGGGIDLYVALCSIYVEQDKLLDAVQMLDNISNAEIRQQLDALRPAAPVPDYAPDFYNQYISVSLSADSGALYATTDKEYPSLSEDAYTQPIALESGETTILALTVSDNGLVSKLVTYGYTINGVIEPVTFADSAMEEEIRLLLGLGKEDVIYTDMLWSVESFAIPYAVQTYEDLRWLPYLKTLHIGKAPADQLKHLQGLSYLEKLSVTESNVTSDELQLIANLPQLRELTLSSCQLASISNLSSALLLEYLDLSDNTIGNILPLGSLTHLQELYLSRNAITELSGLKPLLELKVLDVSYNSVISIDPICTILGLERLNVSHNQISTLGNVANLTSLVELNAENNSFADANRLASCTKLESLDISSNAVSDITALAALTKLADFDFSYNQVTALPLWEAGSLRTIDGSYNLLTTLDPLSIMTELNVVLMDYNEALETVEPLKNCPHLVQVNVYGTLVADVAFLLEQSVIVNFNPTLPEP